MNKVLAIACIGTLLACGACRRETKGERIRRDFEEFTRKECPKFVDPCTRLDSACYDTQSRTLSYYYSVCDTLDDPSIYTEEVVGPHHDNIQKELKGSLQLKGYKDEGITFRYIYHSVTTGKVLLEMSFTKEDYK